MALADGGTDDGGGGAVLDAAAGVDPLDLAQQLDAARALGVQRFGEPVQAQQGCVPDAFQQADTERW